ncbi:hypothetical protein GCM10008179_07960 [Hansschlegelia plantiphila]|uniref:OmpR/PhoB-type domain-containing protein n=1 Tax=Hansschlegelia plantiphila TaxID=374655 RepID=A0A9W6IZX7_9HYPH|nr:helix-turn-helix domain-containing protein [Hansschlegelia plantiphila]GLK67158.1 hypothetical protein GCM10008179_07960 [Hansschlegelia plantiphila]
MLRGEADVSLRGESRDASDYSRTKVADVYVRYLRRKLGDDEGAMIRTLWGVGYMLTKDG